jgi:uncharacterized protein (DUF2147 family)
MKIITTSLIMTLLLFALSCGRHNTSSNAAGNRNANQAVAEASSSSTGVPATQAESAPKAKEAPKLIGTYEATEVHSGGVITMISSVKTSITFLADGSYSRVSEVEHKPSHTDAGDFRIEGDKLVLMTKLSESKVFKPPREVTYTFELSPDGEELKLTSAKGNVAIFRRTS